jgi:transmembrane sensor
VSVRFRWIAISVAVVALPVCWYWFFAFETHQAALGDRKLVVLNDGSTIELNTGTRVDVRYRFASRVIKVSDKGEVLLTVRSDANRPFVVLGGFHEVRPASGRFNVTVSNGVVGVLVLEGTMGMPMPSLPKPGQLGVVGYDYFHVDDLTPTQIEQRLAWRAGMAVFDDTLLFKAVDEVNRYNVPQIEIVDGGLDALRITGRVAVPGTESFLALLKGVGVGAQQRGDVIALTRQSRN